MRKRQLLKGLAWLIGFFLLLIAFDFSSYIHWSGRSEGDKAAILIILFVAFGIMMSRFIDSNNKEKALD